MSYNQPTNDDLMDLWPRCIHGRSQRLHLQFGPRSVGTQHGCVCGIFTRQAVFEAWYTERYNAASSQAERDALDYLAHSMEPVFAEDRERGLIGAAVYLGWVATFVAAAARAQQQAAEAAAREEEGKGGQEGQGPAESAG
ncbi:hypothetical protein EDC01DRAFT_626104 [Geopyxis carbonaria]|nr:hypothetical protein EDC01DRAFT_626104 [Geopyxis carbonaria]